MMMAGSAAFFGLAARKALPVTEGYTDVPGGKIYWKKVGAGDKTPLLTLHGGPGAAHNYLLPLAALGDERPVIFYDQLGTGKADAPTDEAIYTIQRSVDELDAVRAALKLDRVVLFGHSWGAMLAIEYLCQGRGKGIDDVILGGALASTPQAIAGQQRLIDGMGKAYADQLHGLEKAGKMDTPEYAALTQKFYDKHVLRAKPTADALASFEALGKSIAYRVMNGPNEFYITGVIKDWIAGRTWAGSPSGPWSRRANMTRSRWIATKPSAMGLGSGQPEDLQELFAHDMVEKPVQYVATLRKFLG